MLSRRRFLAHGAALGLAAGCQARRRHPSDLRRVEDVVRATPTREGAGVSLRRALGSRALPMLDPFLMLDEIHSDRAEDWIAGFPTHPHRGFETVSYLIAGTFAHEDSTGTRGVIGPGDAQWMTAARGIVHSEMPRQEPGRDMWGLQLWVNLPAKDKMVRPRYQEIGRAAIPELDVGDARTRVVAGVVGQTRGPIDGVAVAPVLLDAALPAGGVFRHGLPVAHSAFAYVLDGAVELAGVRVAAGELAVLGRGREVEARSAGGGRFLLVAGTPLGEPVARRGPFVMNTEAEIEQAFADYRSGRLTDG